MAFDGQLLAGPPSDGREIAVSDALIVGYTGVYVPPPAEPVLSPNGDGVDETQVLSYQDRRARRRCRRSLVGPDGTTIPLDSGARTPGTYRFTLDRHDGDLDARARRAVALRGDGDRRPGRRSSQADRTFALNNTLALAARAAGGGQGAQEGHARGRVVHARARCEGHRDGRDAAGRRRPRPRAQALGAGRRAVDVERPHRPPARSRTRARTGCTSPRRTRSARPTSTRPSPRAGRLAAACCSRASRAR